MIFSDEFAPVWRDPATGEYSVWTSTRFKAAGYVVAELRDDLYVVDLESRTPSWPPSPTPDDGGSDLSAVVVPNRATGQDRQPE